ncbi:putative cysteine peptidase [Mycoplasma sp. 4404]|uniref:putative cysteine peptidase n=1 Tax=Mycoplasma sp. 4404 TaxID=3108530 RepID=UPI002B1D16BE|nr:hypothetical protein [Mycoplasma sp. 4404]MEA4162348.1 hypothetical protein [Mycoplasma sp. 4404]
MKNTKLILSIFTTGVIALPTVSASINNNVDPKQKDENEMKQFLVDSEIARLSRLSGKTQKFKIVKEIKDIQNNSFLLIATDEMFSVVNANIYTSNEIHYETIKDEWLNSEIIYDRWFGLLKLEDENTYKSLYNESKILKSDLLSTYKEDELREIEEFKQNQLLKREKEIRYSKYKTKTEPWVDYDLNRTNYNYDGHFKVSSTVPYAWWFATRNNYESAGYVDLKPEGAPRGRRGLCEYVALSQLLLYNHLFVDGTVFTQDQYNKFIKEAPQNNIIHWEHTSPVFKYKYSYHHEDNVQYKDYKKSLTYHLYQLADGQINLKTPNYYRLAFDRFNKNERSSWDNYGKYGGYYRAWENVKKGIPVILGIAPCTYSNGWPDHAYLMYGYDDNSDMFLGSMCWGQEKRNTILYSYYNGAWGSYYFTIGSLKPKNARKQPRLFKYKDKLYTGEEINNLILKKEPLK